MNDERKTKRQLIDQLTDARLQIEQLKKLAGGPERSLGDFQEALAQQSLVGVSIFQNGQVVYANEAAAKISGYSVEELQEKGFDAIAKLTYPEDVAFVREQTEKRLQGKERAISRYSLRIVTKSGETKWLEVFSQAITYQAQPASCSVIIDVTEEKRTEEALKRSEERFRIMFNNSHDLMTISDLDANTVWANKAWRETLGYTPDTQGDPFEKVHPDDLQETAAAWERFLKEGELTNFEYRYKTARGNYVVLETTARKLTAAGKPFVSVIAHDITRRRQVEEALLESEERFRNLMDHIPGVSIQGYELDGTVVYWNKASEKVYGYSAEEALGKNLADLIIPVDLKPLFNKALELGRAAKASGEFMPPGELMLLHKGGHLVPVYSIHTAVCLEDEPPLLFCIDVDLTARKRAEEDLRESEKRYRLLAENVKDVIWTMDMNLQLTYVSPSFRRLTKHTVKEAMALTLEQRFTPDSLRVVKEAFEEELAVERRKEKKLKRSWMLELEEYCKDGETVWTEARMTFLRDREGTAIGVLVVSRDITIRRKAERALRESERRYRELAESLPTTVCEVNEKGEILYTNQAGFEAFGYTRGDLDAGLNVIQMMVAEDRDRAGENVRKVLGGQRLGAVEYTAERKDGTTFPVIIRSEPVIRGGRPVGFLGIVVDITQRKRVEDALRESEQKYRRLFESAPESIFLIGMDGRILDCNQATRDIVGLPKERIIGRRYNELGTLSGKEPAISDALARLRRGEDTGPLLFKATPKGKQARWLEVFPTLINVGGVSAVQAIACDITEKRKMEEELLRAQKLDSLGILAGGIAHDFNNLLGVILANVSLAQKGSQPGAKVFERLEEAQKALARAKNLARQLLTFSKGGAPVKKTVSIAGIVTESADLALRGSKVVCDLRIPEELWPVEIDEGQMYQVINNIIINAVQAMPDGGTVTVRAENVPAAAASSPPLPGCSCVRVSIEDQGTGIPEEHLSRIFDPYFTTKRQGIGLGLTTAYSIVNKHEGYIGVESELGGGTTFSIYLPASGKRLSTEPERARAAGEGSGRILLVDDEEAMLQAAAAVLQELGYDVELARGGDEAIQLYHDAMDSTSPFDLVIMDLTIPRGLGGKEAIRRLREIDPNVKAIASTGYTDDPILTAFEDFGFRGVLGKPYDIEDMATVVSEVLKETDRN